jgi:hypothetical protein
MDYLTTTTKDVKTLIGSNLEGKDLMNYIHLNSKMVNFSNRDELWNWILMCRYPDVNLSKKPKFMTLKDFVFRIVFQSGYVRINLCSVKNIDLQVRTIQIRKSYSLMSFYCIDIYNNLYHVRYVKDYDWTVNMITTDVIKIDTRDKYVGIIKSDFSCQIIKNNEQHKTLHYHNDIKHITFMRTFSGLSHGFVYAFIDMNNDLYCKNNNKKKYLIDTNVSSVYFSDKLIYQKEDRLYLINIPNKSMRTISETYHNFHLLIESNIKTFNMKLYTSYEQIIEVECLNGHKYLYDLNSSGLDTKRKIRRKLKNKDSSRVHFDAGIGFAQIQIK